MPIVVASSFADPPDVRAYRKWKATYLAQGFSDHDAEKKALYKGDNGIGFWDEVTATEAECLCALPPEDLIPRWGSLAAAGGKPVLVTWRGKTIRGRVGDLMPAKANIENGAGIDLNPGFQRAFGVTPPVMMQGVSWNWADDVAQERRPIQVSVNGYHTTIPIIQVPENSRAAAPSSLVRDGRTDAGAISPVGTGEEDTTVSFLKDLTDKAKQELIHQTELFKKSSLLYLPGGYATAKALASHWARRAEDECADKTQKAIFAQKGMIDDLEKEFDWNRVPEYLRGPIREGIDFMVPYILEKEVALANHLFEGDWSTPINEALERAKNFVEVSLGVDLDGDNVIGAPLQTPKALASVATKGIAAGAGQAAAGVAALTAPGVK